MTIKILLNLSTLKDKNTIPTYITEVEMSNSPGNVPPLRRNNLKT